MPVDTLTQIIIPVDGSEHARHAAAFGGGMAARLGVPVVLVYAFPKSPSELLGLMGFSSVPSSGLHLTEQDIERTLSHASRHAFDSARRDLADSGVEVHEEVIRGTPAEAIVEFAASRQPTMIVMGTRGLSPVTEMLLGSISERVMRNAPCPVTLVR